MSDILNQMIRDELRRRNLSERAASERAGLSAGTLNNILRNARRNPDAETVIKIAHFFKFDEDYVLELSGHRRPRTVREAPEPYTAFLERMEAVAPVPIPLIDQIVHAGSVGGVPTDYVYVAPQLARGRKLVATHVRGDCMEPKIWDGDEIIVDLDASPKPGDIVVVLVNGDEVELRRIVQKTNGTWKLSCENPKYPESEMEEARVIGVVIRVSRDV